MVWELRDVGVGNGAANIVPDHMYLLRDADMLGEQVEDISREFFLGVAGITQGVGREAMSSIIWRDDVISSLSEWLDNEAELMRTLGKAVNEEDRSFLLLGG